MKRYSDIDLQTMVLTVLAEARGESQLGQKAVAWVIKNRWMNPGWWSRNPGDGIPDDTIAAVCRDPFQFSCWNRNDPNFGKMAELKLSSQYDAIERMCRDVLEAESEDDDPTFGCDHYCVKTIAEQTSWAKGRKPMMRIGNHWFYKIGLA